MRSEVGTEAGTLTVVVTVLPLGRDALPALALRPAGWRGGQVAVHVDNLWNDHFQETPAVPASPRQASLSVTQRW